MIRYTREGTYTFVHDQIRECLYAQVTPIRRKRLHGFVGRAIELSQNGDDARKSAELAFHFARSGDRSRGVMYARLAAQGAMETYAFKEALAYYRTAVDLLAFDDPERGGLLLTLGEAAILAGSESAATTAFEDARQWFLDAGDLKAAARSSHGLGQAFWRQDQLADAQAAFDVAAGLLRHTESALAVHVLVDLASLLAVSLGKQSEGVDHARRALKIARSLSDPRLEAAANRTLGNLLVRGNRIGEGVPLLERALELAEATDDPAEAAECCSCLTLAYKWMGEIRQSADMIDRRLAYAERSHDLYQLRHVHTWRVASAIWEWDWDEAERLLDESQAIAERLSGTEPLAFVYNIRGAVAWWRGDHEAAEQWLIKAMAIFRRMGPTVLVWYLAPLGVVQLLLGKHQEASECMAEVEALLEPLPAGTIQSADPLVYLSMMAISLGDRERAERYYIRLLPFSGLHIDFLVDRILGELATLLENWEAARGHLHAAEEVSRRRDDRASLAFTLEAQATLELARHGRRAGQHARKLLVEARSLFEAFGMAGEVRRIDSRLSAVPLRPAAGQPSLPAKLSAREAEVLRLVAAGKTNRQVADLLFISEKTVINHLTSILAKTGADNRASAAAFAVRHGLA